MRPLQIVILFLAASGCSSLPEQEPVQLSSAPPDVSQQHTPTLSPAAKPASSKTEMSSPQGNRLMDCVTESCRINCSPSVPKRSKPKWCLNFKEPVVEKPKFAADLVPKRSLKPPDIDPNRHAALVNYDGAVLHLFDAYAFLAGISSQYSDERPRRVPLWWPLHFHQ